MGFCAFYTPSRYKLHCRAPAVMRFFITLCIVIDYVISYDQVTLAISSLLLDRIFIPYNQSTNRMASSWRRCSFPVSTR